MTVDAVIPWIPDPAPEEPTPTPTPTAPPLNLPFCRADQVALREGPHDAGLGHHSDEIVLANRSTESCKVSGLPSVALFSRTGRLITDTAVSVSDDGFFPTHSDGDVEVKAGVALGAAGDPPSVGQAALSVQYLSAGCFPTPIAAMRIQLPHDGSLLKAFSPPLEGFVSQGCLKNGVMVSSFQRAPLGPPPPPPVDLSVQYHLPSSARLGHDLVFSVSLTNVSGHTIIFDTCPGYTEWLITSGARERHLLNCAPVRSLRPGETRTFAMRLIIPNTVRRDLRGDSVSWSIDLPLVSADLPGWKYVEFVP